MSFNRVRNAVLGARPFHDAPQCGAPEDCPLIPVIAFPASVQCALSGARHIFCTAALRHGEREVRAVLNPSIAPYDKE